MSQVSEAIEKLTPEQRTAFRRLVLSLADTKRILGIRYSDWLLGAPSIEAGIAISSMAQDEWGHARLIYSVLKDFGEDPLEVEHERPSEEYCSVEALDEPFQDWAGVVAGIVVVDGALTVALRGLGEGNYEGLTGRISKMLDEEEFHQDLGRAWFRRLADAGGEARSRLVDQVQATLPTTLYALFPDDDHQEALVAAGIVPGGADLRARFQEEYADLLALGGLEIPGPEELPDGWNEERSRGPGHPGEEAVERARGDRNRALFVE